MKINEKSTFAIAKGLHHANAAKFYFEQVINELNLRFTDKHTMNGLAAIANKIVTSMLSKVPDGEVKNMLLEEMQDPLAIDAFCDTFIKLNLENRTKAEDYLEHILNTQISAAIRAKQGYSEEYVQGLVQGKDHFEQMIKEKERELAIIRKEYEHFRNLINVEQKQELCS